MIADWLIIVAAVVVLWVLWLFMRYVLDLFAYAANRGEDLSANKERERS